MNKKKKEKKMKERKEKNYLRMFYAENKHLLPYGVLQ